jgi:holo-ACP synthase CitX
MTGHGGTLIETASIMPGLPKHRDGLACIFLEGLKEVTAHLNASVIAAMTDAAGYYSLARSPLDGGTCKRFAVAVEEQWPWNRLLDIDCFAEGSAVTRKSLRLPERRCLVCNEISSRCIHERRHSIEIAAHSAWKLIDAYLEFSRQQ